MKRIYLLIVYQFSADKRKLDRYIHRIRRLQTLSDIEWIDFRTLAQNELDITTAAEEGFAELMFKYKDRQKKPTVHIK